MTVDQFRMYCLRKPGVTEDYPFNGEAVWMKVQGKMFALANVSEIKLHGEIVPPFYLINLKCDPERAVQLRELYPSIRPGWHMNKTHWNSLYLQDEETVLSDQLILELIDHAYDLVVKSLPKSSRDQLK